MLFKDCLGVILFIQSTAFEVGLLSSGEGIPYSSWWSVSYWKENLSLGAEHLWASDLP